MGSSVDMQTRVRVSAQHASCDLHGQVVILDLQKGFYYGLEEIAARIWHLLEQPRKVLEIRDAIAAEYDVTPQRCEQDLLAFLDNLDEAGLIECERSDAERIDDKNPGT
jgi:coenzyme PQQ synthesis protein D (PqqD)